ncbi:MAG TPA: hypothetical protein VIY53_05235 [Acidobacteriaceae bacterium]
MGRLSSIFAALAGVAVAFAAPGLHAQTTAAAEASAVTPVSCPPSATLDQLIVALDDAVSGPASKDRTCMKQLLLPEVRLIPVNPATGAMRVLSVDDWIAAVAKNGDAVVTEQQIKYQSQTFGHIAHLWSTYTTALGGKPLARGINSIQAVFDGQNWKVVEIVWQAETPDVPIPAGDLP